MPRHDETFDWQAFRTEIARRRRYGRFIAPALLVAGLALVIGGFALAGLFPVSTQPFVALVSGSAGFSAMAAAPFVADRLERRCNR